MIGGRSGRRGARWPLFAVLVVVASATVVGASTMASRSLVSKIDEAEQKVSRFVAEEIGPSLEGVDLTEPMGGGDADRLTSHLERGVLSGAATARVRVFAPNGILLYSSDEGDRVGSTSTGNVDLIRAAAGGAIASTSGGDQVVTDGRAQSLQLLQVYAPLASDGPSEAAIGVDLRYKTIAASASRPWETIQLGAAIAAVVFLVLTLFELGKAITAKSLAARSGFTGADASRAAARAAAKEAKVRQGLEDQIEAARAQVRAREEENAAAAQRFADQLQDMSRQLDGAMARIEEAERREPSGVDPGVVQAAVARAEEAEAREAAGMDTIRSLEGALALAGSAPEPTVDTEALEEAERLRAELEHTRERLRQTESGLDEAHARASALEASVTDAAGLDERLAPMADLERRVADAESALDAQRQRAAATEDARAALEAQLAAAIARGDELTPELTAATARADDAEVRARELQAKLEAAVGLGATADQELASARSELDAVRSELESARRDVSGLREAAETSEATHREAVLAIESELGSARAALEEAVERIRQGDARTEAAEARLSAAASELSTEAATLGAELDAERERARRAEARVQGAEQRASGLEQHASSLAQALEDERVKREETERAASEVRTRVEDAERRAEEALARVGSIEEGATSLAEARVDAEERAERATLAAEEAESRVDALQRSVTELTGELASVRSEADAARAATSDAEVRAVDRVRTLEAEMADRRAATVEAETIAQTLRARADELEAAARRAEMRILELEAVVAEAGGTQEKVAELTAALQMRDALVRERDERLARAEERATHAEEKATAALGTARDATEALEAAEEKAAIAAQEVAAAREAAGPPPGPDADRVAELEREVAEMNEEIDQSQTRLRRAYAETENVRAQLEAATPRMGLGADEAATEEIQRLRVELGQAIERAAAAESRASRLQADLAEARVGGSPPDQDDAEAPQEDEDRSLRFRLARSAARKKGLGDDEQMWS